MFICHQFAFGNSPEALFNKVPCQSELKHNTSKLFDLKKTDLAYDSSEWLPVIEYKPFQKIFRKPIEIGKWIEIEFDTHLKKTKIYQMTEQQIVETDLDK